MADSILIYKVHHNEAKGFTKLDGTIPAHKLIEDAQKNLENDGKPTGITWQVIRGGIVDAMIRSALL